MSNPKPSPTTTCHDAPPPYFFSNTSRIICGQQKVLRENITTLFFPLDLIIHNRQLFYRSRTEKMTPMSVLSKRNLERLVDSQERLKNRKVGFGWFFCQSSNFPIFLFIFSRFSDFLSQPFLPSTYPLFIAGLQNISRKTWWNSRRIKSKLNIFYLNSGHFFALEEL